MKRRFSYGIILGQEWYHFTFRAEAKQIEHCEHNHVEKRLRLCKTCPTQGALCHVIEDKTGRKFCPILIHDLSKATWNLRAVNGSENFLEEPHMIDNFTLTPPPERIEKPKPKQADLFGAFDGTAYQDPRQYRGIEMDQTPLGRAANEAADRENQEALL